MMTVLMPHDQKQNFFDCRDINDRIGGNVKQ